MSMLSANDRFEVLDLCSRYTSLLDRGDTEGVMDCWSKNSMSYESPFGKFTNWEKLRQYLNKEMHGGTLSGKRHVLFNVVIREGDEIDTAFIDAEYLVIDKDHLVLLSSGSFKNDKVQRISLGWKFVHRSQFEDKIMPVTSPTATTAKQKDIEASHH